MKLGHLVTNTARKWVHGRYQRLQAERAYAQEKERQTSLLTAEIAVLESELAPYDISQTVLDYEGIKKIRIDGEIVTAWTTTEQYTVRIQEDDALFTFLENLKLPPSTNTLIDRTTWIITSRVATHVLKEEIPNLDFLYVDRSGARIHVDLSKPIELTGIRGILCTLQGEFNLELNMDKINHLLQALGERLNHGRTSSVIKIDATNVRQLTFYLENNEGDVYHIQLPRRVDVEKLILRTSDTTKEIMDALRLVLPEAETELELRKYDRIRREREVYRQAKVQLIAQHIPFPSFDVEVTGDPRKPSITLNRLNDALVVRANAVDDYLPVLIQFNEVKRKLQQETAVVYRYIQRMCLSVDEALPYSLVEQYIRIDIDEANYQLLVEEVRVHTTRMKMQDLRQQMQLEQPQVRAVLERFTFKKKGQRAYSLEAGYIDPFLTEQEYLALVSDIRKALRKIALYELSDTHQSFPSSIPQKLFGCIVQEKTELRGGKQVQVVRIEKEGQPVYQKRFKDGKLLPVFA